MWQCWLAYIRTCFTFTSTTRKSYSGRHLLPLLEEADDIIDGYNDHSADLFRDIIRGWWDCIGAPTLASITKLVIVESGNFPDLVTFYREEISMW